MLDPDFETYGIIPTSTLIRVPKLVSNSCNWGVVTPYTGQCLFLTCPCPQTL